jgi:ribonuclease P protein component
MNRRHRLRKSTDFKRVRRAGRSFAHPLAVLSIASNGLPISRCSISAGRALGGAVQRNRIKRRLREALRNHYPAIAPGWDIILIARPAAMDADWAHLLEAVSVLLARAGVLMKK